MFDFIRRIIKRVHALPGPLNALITAGFHFLVALAAGGPGFIAGRLALAVLGSAIVAVLYTRRELRQVRDAGFTAPEYDHIADASAPWLAVVIYALLV